MGTSDKEEKKQTERAGRGQETSHPLGHSRLSPGPHGSHATGSGRPGEGLVRASAWLAPPPPRRPGPATPSGYEIAATLKAR